MRNIKPINRSVLEKLPLNDYGNRARTALQIDRVDRSSRFRRSHWPAETFDLGFNQLTTLSPDTFNDLAYLEKIWLLYNNLTSIDPSRFGKLTSLKWLALSDNKLTEIEPTTFNGPANLEILFLSKNRHTSLHPATFNGLKKLK